MFAFINDVRPLRRRRAAARLAPPASPSGFGSVEYACPRPSCPAFFDLGPGSIRSAASIAREARQAGLLLIA